MIILNTFKSLRIQTCSDFLVKESETVSHLHVHHFQVPNWVFIIGMDVGIIILPVAILGSLFVIVKAIVGV